METEKGSPAENRTSHASRFKGGGEVNKTALSYPVTGQSYAGRLFYLFLLSMYVSNAKINIANSNINESVWKTLIDCETFLKIIPCSHGPHLAREKTATALKTF